MPFFICPNCGNRELSADRTAGFSTRPKGCSKCGFGFVFELLDDYYPAPNAAFFVCDREARVIDAGRGSFELTGLTDEDVIGRARLAYKWIFRSDSHFGETLKTESGDSNTFTESVTELRLALVGKLYAQASYTVRQNSKVPAGTEKTDTITAFSLGWTFGK